MTDYITDEANGKNWRLLLGDSCERLRELDADSVDLSVCSPPFASLFTYSPSPRDLGNSSTRGEFLEHYSFIIREQLRVTKPGRLACIHVQQLTTSKATHGYMGMTDFRGEVIRAFETAGWYFNGEVTVWKDPQAQSIRTRSHALAFATKNRDSASTGQLLYVGITMNPPQRFKAHRDSKDWWDHGRWSAPSGVAPAAWGPSFRRRGGSGSRHAQRSPGGALWTTHVEHRSGHAREAQRRVQKDKLQAISGGD